MEVLILMIPMSLLLGFGFLYVFIWSVEKDQWSDIEKGSKLIFDPRESEHDE